MSQGWENYEPAPIEFMHGRMMDLFHEFRNQKGGNLSIEMDGSDFNNIIVKAKTETYAKYPKQNLNKEILKTEV